MPSRLRHRVKAVLDPILPRSVENQLRRTRSAWHQRRGVFDTPEPEYRLLDQLVRPGDVVVDVGANIGHYTYRMAQLVGPSGHVVALEPVPKTFSQLTENTQARGMDQVHLVNAAAGSEHRFVTFDIPDTNRRRNYYRAMVSATGTDGVPAMMVTLDGLGIPGPVVVVKIDVEGHELAALEGFAATIRRDRPVLVVEDNDPAVREHLEGLGYAAHRHPSSPNWVFVPAEGSRSLPPEWALLD